MTSDTRIRFRGKVTLQERYYRNITISLHSYPVKDDGKEDVRIQRILSNYKVFIWFTWPLLGNSIDLKRESWPIRPSDFDGQTRPSSTLAVSVSGWILHHRRSVNVRLFWKTLIHLPVIDVIGYVLDINLRSSHWLLV